MPERRFSSTRHPLWLVFVRGVSFGCLGGGAMGAVAGTCLWPVVGTVIGLYFGVVFGLAVGVPSALTLTLIASKLADADVAGSAGAILGLIWSAVVVAGFDVMDFDDFIADSPTRTIVIALLGALVGGVVAPHATFRRDAVAPRTTPDSYLTGAL